MISIEDLSRLSVEMSAREFDIFVWAEKHGLEIDTIDSLAHSFLENFGQKAHEIAMEKVREMIEEEGEDAQQEGMMAIPMGALMMSNFVQSFIFGWEAAVQFGAGKYAVTGDGGEENNG